jgi:hypothetical protein
MVTGANKRRKPTSAYWHGDGPLHHLQLPPEKHEDSVARPYAPDQGGSDRSSIVIGQERPLHRRRCRETYNYYYQTTPAPPLRHLQPETAQDQAGKLESLSVTVHARGGGQGKVQNSNCNSSMLDRLGFSTLVCTWICSTHLVFLRNFVKPTRSVIWCFELILWVSLPFDVFLLYNWLGIPWRHHSLPIYKLTFRDLTFHYGVLSNVSYTYTTKGEMVCLNGWGINIRKMIILSY